MKVTGKVNQEKLLFEETARYQYEAAAKRSGSGYYDTEIMAEDDYGNLSIAWDSLYTEDVWIEPVWWRTKEDVAKAAKMSMKLFTGGWNSLTTEEQREWLLGMIGFFNFKDLNRIEIDTKCLSERLDSYGYNQKLIHNVDWSISDLPDQWHFDRILANIRELLSVYHEQPVGIPASVQTLDFKTVNDIEATLKHLKDMIGRMEQSFRYSNTFVSGQEVYL